MDLQIDVWMPTVLLLIATIPVDLHVVVKLSPTQAVGAWTVVLVFNEWLTLTTSMWTAQVFGTCKQI